MDTAMRTLATEPNVTKIQTVTSIMNSVITVFPESCKLNLVSRAYQIRLHMQRYPKFDWPYFLFVCRLRAALQ